MNGLIKIKNVRAYIDEKGIASLNLEDVARGLGFEKTEIKNGKEYKSIRWATIKKYLEEIGFANKLSKDLKVIGTSVDGIGNTNLPEYIQENIFYKLCMKANNEVARKFQDLVCDEILPSIRKNGMYAVDNLLDNPDLAIQAFTKLKEEREQRKILESKVENLVVENETQKQIISEIQPVKDYMDTILSSEDTMTISQIGADYGKSGIELNKILYRQGLIRKVGGQWILYKEHMNKGYTKSETVPIPQKDGRDKLVINTKWTQKGRLKIHEILTSIGIKANQDKEKVA
ncbi:phage antirepressor KilAC domain-containing protein [Fusobacterium ulcerans]|jgi:phage antirepressor YoqD-like protein|uniref:phage antirepressor KilAC domain-containing protein n=1 Tax=Fusobacterium ulcerans TaxID=861 RepID=UPI002672953F|nr:phage antirepressor KilAC domain-containing protein [Fusobacterium ulcerans]